MSFLKNGTPDKIRTCDLLLRRQALYPAELRAHIVYILEQHAVKSLMPFPRIRASCFACLGIGHGAQLEQQLRLAPARPV